MLEDVNTFLQDNISKSRATLRLFWIITVVLTLVLFVPPIVLFTITFSIIFWGEIPLSSSISDWGYFGEFWWNCVIAFTSVINVFAFIYISSIVAKMQKNQSTQTNKKQTLLAFAKFKFELVNELVTKAHHLETSERRKGSDSYPQFQLFLLSFRDTYLKILFNVDEDVSELRELFMQLKDMQKEEIITNKMFADFVVIKNKFITLLLENIRKDMEIEDNTANT